MLVVGYATGRASHARQVKGDDPDEKGYPDPPGWGLGVRLTLPSKKIITKPQKNRRSQGPPRAVETIIIIIIIIITNNSFLMCVFKTRAPH